MPNKKGINMRISFKKSEKFEIQYHVNAVTNEDYYEIWANGSYLHYVKTEEKARKWLIKYIKSLNIEI